VQYVTAANDVLVSQKVQLMISIKKLLEPNLTLHDQALLQSEGANRKKNKGIEC
jgi:hypothetical protein